ncbi:MAG: formimidoylglutamate deiminase [Pseudomonadota bacterium]
MAEAVIRADRVLLSTGWAGPRTVRLDGGVIASIEPDGAADHRVDILLPAPGNLHSHAFQRAMAGLTEHRSEASADSFWTWRALMYRFVEALTPEAVEAIAAQLYVEMLEAGYASVGEFHYLHHQADGTPYAAVGEMAHRIAAAAAETGVGLTLLPVLYSQGGADGRPLTGGQRRFGTDPRRFDALLDSAESGLSALPDAVLGVAPHSLRAVPKGALAEISTHLPDAPIHMHIAEQVPEVEEIQAAYGARPVEWALTNLLIDDRWCLIHATQMTPEETDGLARTGAVAGLCPITEANLGDGIFDGGRYLHAGGAFGVGSDSNLRIGLAEELRQLEHSQRLRDQARSVMAEPPKSVGRTLFEAAARGAAQALGRGSGRIEIGARADLVALDGEALALVGRQDDRLLDAWIFAGDDRVVRDVWSAGRHLVREGRHVGRDVIEARFRVTLSALMDAL